MALLLAILAALAAPDHDALALHRFAPRYLTALQASAHLQAARAAALVVGDVDADDLLAIAWHETRYTPGYVQREPGGCHKGVCRSVRYSCGVMTPEPLYASCPRGTELVDEYIAGARHLLEWREICGGALEGARLCALRGYSGGMLDNQLGNSGLATWQVFARDAWRIKAARIQRPP